ncbi:hypothetical protein LDP08_22650 [Ralstonia pseudosolanacearum]|uniref:hypothetical protein n=1 Tax=Ralstonia pseudosolanacearum TaxID=1310165 RepID=UPI003CECE978
MLQRRGHREPAGSARGHGMADKMIGVGKLVDSVQGIPAAEMRTFWAVLQRIADNLSKTAGNETVLD